MVLLIVVHREVLQSVIHVIFEVPQVSLYIFKVPMYAE